MMPSHDERALGDRGRLVVFFNDDSAVCRSEMRHYERDARRAGREIDFRAVGATPDALAGHGLAEADLRRRLYVLGRDGAVRGGIDAFAALWRELPRLRWAAAALRVPGLGAACALVYDGAVVPFLARRNRRRFRRPHRPLDGPLYQWLLGDAFQHLPPAVQRLHAAAPTATATGTGTVTLGANRASRLLARCLGFPAAGAARTLRITITSSAGGEVLSRRYPDATLTTAQSAAGPEGSGLLRERFGPVSLILQLEARAHGLSFTLRDVRLLGLSLPRVLRPTVQARETADDGVYHFFVRIDLPLLGRLVQYRGSLPEIADA